MTASGESGCLCNETADDVSSVEQVLVWPTLVCPCRNVLSSQEVVDFISERLKPDEGGHVRALSSIIEEVSEAHGSSMEALIRKAGFSHFLSLSEIPPPVLLAAAGPLSGPRHIRGRDRLRQHDLRPHHSTAAAVGPRLRRCQEEEAPGGGWSDGGAGGERERQQKG